MKGLLLLLIAWILILPISLINVILVASKSKTNGWIKTLSGYFQGTARNIDIFGANEFRSLWNAIIVKENGVKFKGDGKTISAYLGANQTIGTLTWFGRLIANFLDLIDANHCRKAYINELK